MVDYTANWHDPPGVSIFEYNMRHDVWRVISDESKTRVGDSEYALKFVGVRWSTLGVRPSEKKYCSLRKVVDCNSV